jgi:predicted PurR-regulated permease PerM
VLAREVASLVHEAQQAGYTIPTPERLEELWANLRDRSPIPLPADANLSNTISSGAQKITTFLASKAGAVLQNVFSLVFQLFIMLFGLFFFLRDRHTVVQTIRQLLPFEPVRREQVIDETYNLTVATVGSTFAVAAAQGALTGFALWVLGFRAPVFWGVMTSIFSVLPAVGSAIVWVPAAIWLFALGDAGKAILLVVWGAVVVGMADNILRPLLLSGRTSMHGLLVFISVMGGMAAFGFIGLALGPIVIAALRILLGAVRTDGGTAPAAGSAAQAPAAKPPEAEAGAGV